MSLANQFSLFASKRRWLNRIVRNYLPAVAEVKITDSFKLFTDPTDLYGPSFYVNYGGPAAFYHYEEDLKAEIMQHLTPDGVFFDIGANIGLISLFVHKFYPEVSIHCFEPADSTHTCLSHSLEANKITNIKLHKKGVGDRNGIAKFFIDPKSNGGSSLVVEHAGEPVEIELVTLDSYIESTNQIPTLIKVDVEGAEEFVIKGGTLSIKKFRPIMIIESDNQKILSQVELWQKIFVGYKFRPIGTTQFYELAELKDIAQSLVNKRKMTIDYLFVPKN